MKKILIFSLVAVIFFISGCDKDEENQNSQPVANAGADMTVGINELVQLDGSASSDSDNNALTYNWKFVSKPIGSITTLSESTNVNSSFTPDFKGSYKIELIVSDGEIDSNPDTVNIEVSQIISFNDINLEAAIRIETNRPTGNIYSADLEKLTSLIATQKEIVDLNGLEYCLNLTELQLWGNEIVDITELASLTQLEILNIGSAEFGDYYGNNISDITPLASLSNLKWLSFIKNNIQNLKPLENLTTLEYLSIRQNDISDISQLKNLTNLKTLDMNDNSIANGLSVLTNLTNLEHLEFARNNSSDISALANLTKLKYQLDIGGNNISDISSLSNLNKLENLAISENLINDISALSNLVSLQWVDLGYNQITDISSLQDCNNNGGFIEGSYLNLTNNNMNITSGTNNLTIVNELISKGVSVDFEEGNNY
jgi:Leucine-rich repeat (LRR) protein